MPNPTNEDYHKLMEHYQKAFQSRREVEWKLALGFWAAIGGVTYCLISVDPASFAFSIPIAETYFTLGLLSFFFWKLPLQHSNAVDSKWIRYYRDKIEGIEPATNGNADRDPSQLGDTGQNMEKERPSKGFAWDWVNARKGWCRFFNPLAACIDGLINSWRAVFHQFGEKQYLWLTGQMGFTIALLMGSYYVINAHLRVDKLQTAIHTKVENETISQLDGAIKAVAKRKADLLRKKL